MYLRATSYIACFIKIHEMGKNVCLNVLFGACEQSWSFLLLPLGWSFSAPEPSPLHGRGNSRQVYFCYNRCGGSTHSKVVMLGKNIAQSFQLCIARVPPTIAWVTQHRLHSNGAVTSPTATIRHTIDWMHCTKHTIASFSTE